MPFNRKQVETFFEDDLFQQDSAMNLDQDTCFDSKPEDIAKMID